MGREIAQVMGYGGIGWLERPQREKEEASSKLHQQLKLKEGMVVADVGAGSGYHTFRMAKAVGDKGKVYAVDVQQEMLDVMKKRIKVRRHQERRDRSTAPRRTRSCPKGRST